MGRSSSSFILLALISTFSASGAAARSTPPLGASVMIAQGYGDAPGPEAGFGGAPYPVGEPGPGLLPPPPFAFAPPPCVKPMIIQIGRGLAHAAKTKIIYGARPPCG